MNLAEVIYTRVGYSKGRSVIHYYSKLKRERERETKSETEGVGVADLSGGGEVAEVRRGIGVVFDGTLFFEKGVVV